MGQYVECKHCFFRFFGRHDHHSGASIAICVDCLSRYRLPTANPWGPTIGERIPLLLIATAERLTPAPGPRRWCHAKHYEVNPPTDTGTCLVTAASPTPCVLPELGPLVEYPIEEIVCPKCNGRSVRLRFKDGEKCPQCNTHALTINRVIY